MKKKIKKAKKRPKRSYLFEILLGIAVILFLNLAWFKNDIGFTNAITNPYWIIVVFIAVRYGASQGMIAALFCSAALIVSTGYGEWAQQEFETFVVPYQQVQLSVLFVLFAFLIGEERNRVNRLLQDRKEDYNKLRSEFENLAIDTLALKNINVELQGRILGQPETVRTLYEVAKSLATLKIDVLYPTVTNLITKIIGSEKCSLYIWEDGQYLLKGSSGWEDAQLETRKVLDINSDIIKVAINETRLTTVKDLFGSADFKWQQRNDPPMVAPLFFGESRKTVAGFITIDDISFLKLNPGSISNLTIMADWISQALDNVYASTTVRLKDIYDSELNVFDYSYGMRRLKEEFLSAGITSSSMTATLVRVSKFDKIDEALQKDVLKALGAFLRKNLRASDTVAHYSAEDTFLVVSAGTNAEGAKIMTGRLQQQLQGFDFQPLRDAGKEFKVNIAASSFDPKLKNETELLKIAEGSLTS